MLSKLLFLGVALTASLATADQSHDIKTAITNKEKLNALKPEDWVFDFEKSTNPSYTFVPGSVNNANAGTWPAAVGTGMTVALLNLGPCSILPAHWHPRATNFVVITHGSVKTWMLNENGVEPIETLLTGKKMTIFPAGSLHFMENTGCENAQLVSALNSEDHGTTNALNSLLLLGNTRLATLLGASNGTVESFFHEGKAGAGIQGVGTASQYGNPACIARCGLKVPFEENTKLN
ncbi:RmlC-like cupin [Tothia fuscella]|uniref:RmlC-like cupin n=1 Tax=Tothia fuscella TaxID=1048955 RepID=A0A9P4U4L3_9PEZI|nr:RmlC-like cupin [Tothia fuscella]